MTASGVLILNASSTYSRVYASGAFINIGLAGSSFWAASDARTYEQAWKDHLQSRAV